MTDKPKPVMTLRERLARRLHFLADRIDPDGAFRCTGYSMTLEGKEGWKLNRENRGFKVWYHGHREYERAHTEALVNQVFRSDVIQKDQSK